MQACDIGWDCERGLLMWDQFQNAVAFRTPAGGSVSEIKLKVQLRPELPELVLQMVADNERLAILKDLALHEVAIPCEEPPMFCQHTRDERFIRNDLFVGCVVSEYPEPAGQPAEHGIGEEGRRRNDLCIQGRHFTFYPVRVADISEHENLLQGGPPMASNRIIRPVIVTCLLSATVLLGGCSPPLPKTWLPLVGGTWGLDHGAWSVLYHVFSGADIPVVQLSIDEAQPAPVHYEIGKRLTPLRDEGILIIGSGNLVHNLRAYAWGQH